MPGSSEGASEEKGALKAKVSEARAKVEALSGRIREVLASRQKASPLNGSADVETVAPSRLKTRRKLVGHFGKVVSVTWAHDSQRLMTASQDGNVIAWNGATAKKAHLIPLKSSWVMFAELSQTGTDMFATGGLDNVATVWKGPEPSFKMEQELYGHDGYVCGARFLGDDKLITTSGDGTAGLWDLKKARGGGSDKDGDDRIAVFKGHEKDVTSVDTVLPGGNDFLTSSTDGTCMLWSVNTPERGPNAILRVPWDDTTTSDQDQDGQNKKKKKRPPLLDVNKAKYVPNNPLVVGCATEALGAYLFDVRARGPVNTFDAANAHDKGAKYSLAFSKSGRLMFVACEDASIEVWDTLLPNQDKPIHCLSSVHSGRVTDIAVPDSGLCVAAVSWDTSG
eukprot:CAMPEP_0118905478 /NCGR_PEP_ID=MMETSP1166-20130328/9468_1 /TAXON_ID=1104430 /ORGANISM="Chrysoreinhardia sp, Strain CCMP3193" /LENGTH=393 /DNA_ID=CAMNT_0006844749 /DNA_START=21 /DNA_END=1198 /DNA_ORIENTATION=-